MVQSINTKALLTLASVVRRPSLLVPHVAVDNISQVNYTALKEICGIRAVVFDKDNTLTSPYEHSLHPAAVSGLEAAQRVFGLRNVAILSNSAGTLDDPGYEDATRIERDLQIAVVRHDEKKPGGLDQVLQHFELDDPSQLCMIGDRLLTDVVFGNLYGLLTIHTLPICNDPSKDNTVARIVRRMENAGLYNNWFGGRYLRRKGAPTHRYWNDQTTRIHEGAHPLVLSTLVDDAPGADSISEASSDDVAIVSTSVSEEEEEEEGSGESSSVETTLEKEIESKTLSASKDTDTKKTDA